MGAYIVGNTNVSNLCKLSRNVFEVYLSLVVFFKFQSFQVALKNHHDLIFFVDV